jgi:integrase/recombinase XerD
MLCLAIDTGCRIDELLTVKRANVDMENLLITVKGKGSKERTIPISLECRKVIYKFLQRHEFDFVFPTRHGGKVYYRSALDQLKKLCREQGVNGVRTSWHTLRHGFALNHVRQGGDVFSLQRMMGHSSLEITRRYVNMNEEDLKLVHRKTSMLSRLRL